jgi:hypothetical protein
MPRTKSTFRKGHKFFPPYSAGAPRVPTIRQQRAAQAATLAAMLDDLATRWRAGESVDPQVYATLINTQRRILQEL